MNLKLIAYAASAAIIIFAGWFFANHFENQGYQKRVSEEQSHQNVELQAAATETQKLQSQLNKAQNELAQYKQKLADLSADNQRLSNGLRYSITSYNSHLPDYSREALVNRINTLSYVFSECTSEYVEVARKADSYIGDLKMMQEAWPK